MHSPSHGRRDGRGGRLRDVCSGAFGCEGPRNGGVFRISYAIGSGIDYLDPALAYTAPAWALLDTTCLRLMSYPDKPTPGSFRLVPEAATGPPTVSRDGRTYTFTVRKGLRFSDGRPVRASAFARAIDRVLGAANAVALGDTAGDLGAPPTSARDGRHCSGCHGARRHADVRFVRPPAAVESRTTMPYMCAVPPTLPVDPEGRAAIPGGGAVLRRASTGRTSAIVIRRNRFYGGNRPHHVDRFDVDLRAASPRDMVMRIDRNEADWGHQVAPSFFDPSLGAAVPKYGINRERFFVKPGFTVRLLVFNASRPLFRDNPELRRAVNLALDRFCPRRRFRRGETDQYLPVRDARVHATRDIYPLADADIGRAKELARGTRAAARP